MKRKPKFKKGYIVHWDPKLIREGDVEYGYIEKKDMIPRIGEVIEVDDYYSTKLKKSVHIYQILPKIPLKYSLYEGSNTWISEHCLTLIASLNPEDYESDTKTR